MDATASVSRESNRALSASLSKLNNIDWQFAVTSYALNRAPEYYIYLYNVSTMVHVVSRPPMLREMKMPARKATEKYTLVTRLPQPLLVPKGNVDSNEIEISQMDTRRFAMDIINPDNLGIDQDAVIDHITAQNNDLGKKGVFWSLNGPGASKYGHEEEPTEQEVKSAYKRMEARYKFLLDQARAVETSDPAKLQDTLSPEHYIAADYFHQETNWHKKVLHKENCPRCGSPAAVGVPFHSMEGGGVCIDGIEGWKSAVKAGVRSRAQAYEATDDEVFAPKVRKQAPVEDEE